MGHYRFSVHIDAPPELVYDLWVDLERATRLAEHKPQAAGPGPAPVNSKETSSDQRIP